MKVRLSKKFVIILGGGLVLCGASGAAAVLIGTDKILGPSYREINGLECTTLQVIKLRNEKSTWVRKYVTSDESADGPTRVRTALRVARAVQEKEKADLVQVAMIDKSGPKDRAAMRGRMIGAQVVYIPDLNKVPEGAAALSYSAYYMDGTPTSDGQFYGMRIDIPLEEVEHLEAKLTDKADCIDPAALAVEAVHGSAPKGGHGAPAGEHGAAKPSGHGEPAGHGEPSEHGSAPVAEGHEAPAAEGHGEEAAAEDSGGWLGSVTGLIFGSKPAAEGEHAAVAPAEHGVAAGGHGPADAGRESGQENAATVEHDAAASATSEKNGEDHGEQAGATADAVSEEKVEEGRSFLDQVKGMIFGGSAGDAAHEEANADAGHENNGAGEAVPEPRTSAEGGKRWSNASEADEIRSDAPATTHEEHDTQQTDAEPAAGGSNEADAAGAAWLEQFRSKQTAPVVDSAKH